MVPSRGYRGMYRKIHLSLVHIMGSRFAPKFSPWVIGGSTPNSTLSETGHLRWGKCSHLTVGWIQETHLTRISMFEGMFSRVPPCAPSQRYIPTTSIPFTVVHHLPYHFSNKVYCMLSMALYPSIRWYSNIAPSKCTLQPIFHLQMSTMIFWYVRWWQNLHHLFLSFITITPPSHTPPTFTIQSLVPHLTPSFTLHLMDTYRSSKCASSKPLYGPQRKTAPSGDGISEDSKLYPTLSPTKFPLMVPSQYKNETIPHHWTCELFQKLC